MTNNVQSTSGVGSLYWDNTNTKQTEEKNDTLSQEDFFSLLTQQLSYQDPSKPADNDQMIAQMTNFTMAEGISDLNAQFQSLASSMTSNSALQASTLVGKKALLESSTLDLNSGEMSKGSVLATDNVDNLTVTIKDKSGQTVDTIELGSQSAGAVRFEWDGKTADGQAYPEGEYEVVAEGVVNGEHTSFPMATFKNIQSVNINGANGIIVNTTEGSVLLSEIAEISV